MINNEEKQQICNNLMTYGHLFHTFMNICNIIEATEESQIATAAIIFTKTGDISLIINKQYWDSCDLKKKTFIIAHECLHIMLKHPIRYFQLLENNPDADIQQINLPMDLTINESLVEYYGFFRDEVDPENTLVWYDTLFSFPVQRDKNYEYYYNLMEKSKNSGDNSSNNLLDSHEWGNLDEDTKKQIEKAVNDIIENICSQIPKDEIKDLNDLFKKSDSQAGKEHSPFQKYMVDEKVKKKAKWESIIKKWVRNRMTIHEAESFQWVLKNRRNYCLNEELLLPSIDVLEKYTNKKDKIDVAFFLDTSGSCHSYAQRFFNAAKSVPTERFNIKFFSFSTYVKEVNLKSNYLPMGGGTSFRIIENAIIQEYGEKYPDAVFILTDGYGNDVVPKHPEKWHWLLTEDYTLHVPNQSKTYKLSQYE